MKKKIKSSAPPKFSPLNDEQKEAYDTCQRNTITFLTGPAGSSKTYTAVAYAANQIMDGWCDKLIGTRPLVSACGEETGFLPGELSMKVAPYLRPLWDCLNDYMGDSIDAVRPNIEIAPLAFVRGRTFKSSVVILDEAQNASIQQLEMLMTRMGRGSKIILCGDSSQSDIRNTPLQAVASEMSHIDGIGHFNFSKLAASIRHPMIPDIIAYFQGRGRCSLGG